MPNRRQPSRLVSLRRSSIWKKGTGEAEFSSGGPPGSFATTASTDHGAFVSYEPAPGVNQEKLEGSSSRKVE
jgi:hypothetical protein